MKNIKKIIESIKGVVNVEERAKTRFYIEVESTKEEKFEIEITLHYPDNSSKHSLPKQWYKNGSTSRLLNSYIIAQTYYTNKDGCFGIFNPTTKYNKLNFDYILEVTEENIKYIVSEIIKTYKTR